MIHMLRFLGVTSLAASCALAVQTTHWQEPPKEQPQRYDGKWWSSADTEERSGFLSGAGDYLTYVAHEKWVEGSSAYAIPRVTDYYKTHPADGELPVVDVWRKVLLAFPPPKPLKGGEVFTNPHGYYDGLYWRGGNDAEHRGFLEGYISCLRTLVRPSSETYSRTVSYYVDKIDDYIEKHPKSDDEAVATILYRFRDMPKPKSDPGKRGTDGTFP